MQRPERLLAWLPLGSNGGRPYGPLRARWEVVLRPITISTRPAFLPIGLIFRGDTGGGSVEGAANFDLPARR
jgi:hypothetical protein